MTDLEIEIAAFEATMNNYVEQLIPHFQKTLDSGFLVTGSVQRRAGNPDLKMEFSNHVLSLNVFGATMMSSQLKSLEEFAVAVIRRVVSEINYPHKLRLKASAPTELGGCQVMTWVIAPECECPKSQH